MIWPKLKRLQSEIKVQLISEIEQQFDFECLQRKVKTVTRILANYKKLHCNINNKNNLNIIVHIQTNMNASKADNSHNRHCQ